MPRVNTALTILPNFALIMVGLALARRFDFGRLFWEGLEKLTYYVLFPALLFRSLAVARLDLAASGAPITAALAFTLAAFALSVAAGPVLGLERKLLAAGSQCGYRFSTYIGLAIAGSLFGTPGVALAALVFGAMIPLVNFLAVAMLAKHGERGFAREIATNPLLLATVAGFAWSAAELPLPAFADQTLVLLGQSSLPMGLLSVGAAMRIEKTGAPLAAHAWWLAVKLVAVPLIAWTMIRTIGFGRLEDAILMICASIPTASGAYILAVRMTGDGRDVATQITVGTVLSMATIPLWIGLVGA